MGKQLQLNYLTTTLPNTPLQDDFLLPFQNG